jgi:hypothetical protein
MTVFDKHRSCEKRNEKVAREGKARRAKVLSQLPDEFTSKQCAEILNMPDKLARALIQRFCEHREVTFDPTIRVNRTYTKCPNT